MRRVIAMAVLAAACSKPKPGQSYKDAVDIVCHVDDAPGFAEASPDERPAIMSRWAETKVTNVEGRALIEILGSARGLARRRALEAAVDQAGLDTCPVFDVLAPWPVPEVAGAKLETLDARATLVMTEGELRLADTVVTLDDLPEQATALAQNRPGTLTLIVDPVTTYGVVRAAIAAVDDSYHRYALTASVGGERGVVPVHVPDPDATIDPELEQMVVGLTADEITVFSISGREGTLAKPRLRAPLADLRAAQTQLQDTLRAIVIKRWEGKTRTAASRRIVLIASDDVTAAVFVPVMASMRRAGDAELYLDVVLGSSDEMVQRVAETRDAPPSDIQAKVNLDASLTGDKVIARIRSVYLGGIRRCSAALDATVVFTVKRNGRTVDARVEADDPAVAPCLLPQVKTWRFAPAVDADGDTREPEVTVTLDLGGAPRPRSLPAVGDARLEPVPDPARVFVLDVEAGTTMQEVRELIAAVPDSYRDLALLARNDTGEGVVPFTRLTPAPDGELILKLEPDRLLMWSRSGERDTEDQPTWMSLEPLDDALYLLVSMLADERRQIQDHRLVILAADAVSIDLVALVMATVRFDRAGKPLHPELLLGGNEMP